MTTNLKGMPQTEKVHKLGTWAHFQELAKSIRPWSNPGNYFAHLIALQVNQNNQWQPVQDVTGIAPQNSKITPPPPGYEYSQLYYGFPNNNYSMNRIYTVVIYYGLEKSFNRLKSDNNIVGIIQNIEQTASDIKGAEQVLVLDKLKPLRQYVSSFNIPQVTDGNLANFYNRYRGTAWFPNTDDLATISNQANHWIGGVWQYADYINKLKALRDNAKYIVDTQAAEREELEKTANALYNQIQGLLDQVTGTEKTQYTNEVSSLVQLDFRPRIEGFKTIIESMEATIAQQYEAAEIEALNAEIEKATALTLEITPVLNQLPGDVQSALQADLAVIKALPDGSEKTARLQELQKQVALLAALTNFDNLVEQFNQLIGKIPAKDAEPIYSTLKQIQKETDRTQYSSVKNSAEKMNQLIVQVEISIAQLNAENISETIALSEKARLAELDAIKAAGIAEKKALLKEYEIKVNELMPGLAPNFQSLFKDIIAKVSDASLERKLSTYAALVPQLQGAIEISKRYAELTPAEITGLELDLRENVILGAQGYFDDLLTQEADSINVESGHKQAGGIGNLAVPLALLSFLLL